VAVGGSGRGELLGSFHGKHREFGLELLGSLLIGDEAGDSILGLVNGNQ